MTCAAFSIEDEFVNSQLPDERLRRRLMHVAGVLGRSPGASFPQAFPESSELEALYRLLNNGRVNLEAMIKPHVDATVERCREAKVVVVAHDTTFFSFPGTNPIDGLGRADAMGRGFSGHFALAIEFDRSSGARTPLGVLGVETVMREKVKGSSRTRASSRPPADNEQLRWARMIRAIERRLHSARPINVGDRETDCYELFAEMMANSRRFVFRMTHDRRIAGEAPHPLAVSDLLWSTCATTEREVRISAITDRGRAPGSRKKHPGRESRIARLEIAAQTVELARPTSVRQGWPASLTLNIVHVREPAPPDGATPVEWCLATTEPINDLADLRFIVDAYRARWLIEEFFKALKTGCSYEKRQLESADALLNALGLSIPMAWSLLRLRDAARQDTDSGPATPVLTARQILVLRAALKGALSEIPSLKECALGVARLGGYMNKSRPPGWIIMARGYEDLLMLEAGWALATAKM